MHEHATLLSLLELPIWGQKQTKSTQVTHPNRLAKVPKSKSI